MQTKPFRSFLAIDLPVNAKRAVTTQVKLLSTNPLLKNIKWVKAKNLHLTLSFLGNITGEQRLDIDRRLTRAINKVQPFTIILTESQLFPNLRRPHSLVLIPKSTELLLHLAHIINTEVADGGIALEKRKFRPHITIGKIKDSAVKLHKSKNINVKFRVNQIKLFKSEPSNQGSRYIPLGVYKIG